MRVIRLPDGRMATIGGWAQTDECAKIAAKNIAQTRRAIRSMLDINTVTTALERLSNRALRDGELQALIKARGGCECGIGTAPCRACSDPISEQEAEWLERRG